MVQARADGGAERQQSSDAEDVLMLSQKRIYSWSFAVRTRNACSQGTKSHGQKSFSIPG